MRADKAESPSAGARPEETLRLVRDLVRAWNMRDPERVKIFYAPEYEGVDIGQAEPQRGPGGAAQAVEMYLRAFPDLRFVEDDVVVQDNRAVLVWTARGTHEGTLVRIPPTRRVVAVRGTSVLTVERGKITRGLHVWDMAGLLRSIGLLPEL